MSQLTNNKTVRNAYLLTFCVSYFCLIVHGEKMIKEILLLSDPVLIQDLEGILLNANPDLIVSSIVTKEQLKDRAQRPFIQSRMLSVGTEIIVPASILSALDCGAYNFHPGPPTYPGRFPSCFFIYDRGKMFGTTVHEMVPKVDSGAINAVDWFEVAPDIDRVQLNYISYYSLLGLFKKFAPFLTSREEALPRIGEVWSGRASTQKDFENLCHVPINIGEDEFKRRYRAIGEGPDHAIETTLYGHRFYLKPPPDIHGVYVGGIKKSPKNVRSER